MSDSRDQIPPVPPPPGPRREPQPGLGADKETLVDGAAAPVAPPASPAQTPTVPPPPVPAGPRIPTGLSAASAYRAFANQATIQDASPPAPPGPTAAPATATPDLGNQATIADPVPETLKLSQQPTSDRPAPDPAPAARIAPAAPRRPAAPRAQPVPLPRPFGEYTLLACLGEGAMGIVYKALHRSLNRIVALKILTPGDQATRTQIQRFINEARTSARLAHPHIVQVYDTGLVDGKHFFTMQLIEGRSLEGILVEDLARFSREPRAAATFLLPVVDALDYAHNAGVIHRDVKPSNVMVDKAGHPYLTDFGLAKDVTEGHKLTKSGIVLGTPCYMSPEAARGETRAVGPASDVFSLGAVLYEMLTGRPPFLGQTYYETMQQVVNTDPVPVRTINPMVPSDLQTICHKALEKELPRRYVSAAALAGDLRAYLAGEAISARPVSSMSLLVRRLRTRRVPVSALAAGALVVVAVLAAVAIAVPRWRHEAEARANAQAEARKTAEALATAKDAATRGDWADAVTRYQALVDARPDLAVARAGLDAAQAGRTAKVKDLLAEGKRHFKNGEVPAAVAAIERALALAPGDARAAELREAVTRDVGWVKLVLTPPDARATRIALDAKTLLPAPGPAEEWGPVAPGAPGTELKDGPYVLVLEHAGYAPLRLPFRIGERDAEGIPVRHLELKATMLAAVKVPPDMVVVPGGPFWLGGDGFKALPRGRHELPTFLIDRTEVTNRAYGEFVTATHAAPPTTWEGGVLPPDAADLPVTGVSFKQADAYAKWAHKRLPTEEEWEKAARGTDGRKFPWGARPDPTRSVSGDVRGPAPAAARTGDESPYGCLHMAGNVLEWTASPWTEGTRVDWNHRVVRGSSYHHVREQDGVALEDCSTRWPMNQSDQRPEIGFRCAQDAP